METFAGCVRRREFDAALELFAPEVTSFGTVAEMTHGRDALLREQWRHVWSRTHGFDFDYARTVSIADDEMLCVMAPWSSFGTDSEGAEFRRDGRATLLLVRDGERWVAGHSHFSLVP
jgi:ketosteroid isomerase-like protein